MSPTIEGVKAHFSQPELYLSNRAQIVVRSEIVRALAPDVAEAGILDLGCGDGSLSRPLLPSAAQLTCVDLSHPMLQLCRDNTPPALRERLVLVEADFLTHPFERQFDLILCVGVLAHVPCVEQAIRRIAQLCRAGGSCLVELTDHSAVWGRMSNAYGRLHRRFRPAHGYQTNAVTVAQVCSLAAQYGLTLRDQRRYSLLLPGMRRMPQRWLAHWLRATMQRRLLARFGSEVILCFEKSRGLGTRGTGDCLEAGATVPVRPACP
jgi:2-polyprenyl-3-methyl-5-hydroxy-6-metoxy-1,4-benzoquinol methylase